MYRDLHNAKNNIAFGVAREQSMRLVSGSNWCAIDGAFKCDDTLKENVTQQSKLNSNANRNIYRKSPIAEQRTLKSNENIEFNGEIETSQHTF